MVSAPLRREVVREMVIRGLSERHALRVIGMRPVPTVTSLVLKTKLGFIDLINRTPTFSE